MSKPARAARARDAPPPLPTSLDRRFEAIAVAWDSLADADGRADSSELPELVERLTGCGMTVVVVSAEDVVAVDGRLRARPSGPGRLLLSVNGGSELFSVDPEGVRLEHRGGAVATGTHPPKPAAAPHWIFDELLSVGVAPGLVLVAGLQLGSVGDVSGEDLHLLVPEAALATAVSVGAELGIKHGDVVDLGGGSEALRRVLHDQLERRLRGDVPDVDDDPGWTLDVHGFDPRLERVHESLLTLADGRVGTRGSPLVGDGATNPEVFVGGVYAGSGAATELVRAPLWSRLSDAPGLGPRRRRLDLRTGVLHEDGPVSAVRFASLPRPGTVVLRAAGPPELLPRSGSWTRRGAISLAARDRRRGSHLERLGAYALDGATADASLAAADGAGFERLLTEQRAAWARRWRNADVVVEGDAALQHAVRVALFHLMASVADSGEAAVGARGLSGSAYRGHVFWDSDVFVLPFLAATHPPSARAMLEYRVRRLPAALAAAKRLGRAGARFAWESAADGGDVTPASARLATGELVRIRTGELEEHIVSDVAWAASCYLDWTNDSEFEASGGRELFVQTARYWASRVRRDAAGRAHIYGVIGPDEYHEPVDDNAFTNVMARWNLRRAARVADVDEAERMAWLETADALVDGYDESTRLYEQFAGFYDLEPLVIAEIAPKRPIAADLLLGAERTRQAQVLKQADVLMLHHLVPDEVESGSLVPNVDYYEPRTSHGSSLSPAIHAAVLARAGRSRAAVESLEIAAYLDLKDLTGTTAGGLHLATMGGVWQALAFGFAGVRVRGDALLVNPRLPLDWTALELALQLRGRPLRLRVDHDGVSVARGEFTVRRHEEEWEVVSR
jgi:trehalose/maltose hydrolase-like predicted phosphorylase